MEHLSWRRVLFLCPGKGGEAVVSCERCIPAGGAGEYQSNTIGKADGHVLLDGEDHDEEWRGV